MKRIRQLLQNSRKYRRQYRQVVVEGPKIIQDLLKRPDKAPLSFSFDAIIVSTEYWSRYGPWIAAYNDKRFSVLAATPSVMESITDTVTHQGMVAVLNVLESPPVTGSKHSSLSYLILDGIADPGNMGTLIRSAVATGIKAVLLLRNCCDAYNPKVIRSAATATFSILLVDLSQEEDDWQACRQWLEKQECRQVYAATMQQVDENASSLAVQDFISVDFAYDQIEWATEAPSALVIGSEGGGLRREIRVALQDRAEGSNVRDNGIEKSLQVLPVHVPMEDNAVESLNAAVCGSIIMFESFRHRRQSQRQSQVAAAFGPEAPIAVT
jgi:tRNA G18 (ribose-2'-O)-methylase SpoU